MLPRLRLLLATTLVPGSLLGQLTTGAIEGTLHDTDGRPVADSSIFVSGGTGFHTVIHSNSKGEFTVTLPYGPYRLSGTIEHGTEAAGATVFVAPLETTHLDLVIDASKSTRGTQPAANTIGIWSDATSGHRYPEAFSLAGLLLSRNPASATEPLNLTGLGDNRITVESQQGFSWTATLYKIQGMDATDSYQPGLPVVLPDVEALDEVLVRNSFAEATSSFNGSDVGIFLAQPGASWHGELSTANTGAALSSTNLEAPASRGSVQQPDQFSWFTRDRLEIGGPVTRWADIYASGSGQWASQTEPLAAPGTDQRSRLLFGNARGRVRARGRDLFDALYSGSRINLSDGGIPAGLEALTSNRLAPSFVLPGGFPGEPETDHFDFLQVGWTHLLPAASGLGAIEVRYGYSTAHIDTDTPVIGESRIELLGGIVSGAPPLANLAVRTRQGIEVAWQPGVLRAAGVRHQIAAGGGWKTSQPRNRFATPSDMNLITANAVPAFVVEYNTPLDSHELVRSFSTFVADVLSELLIA
jgi:hypothetical protein